MTLNSLPVVLCYPSSHIGLYGEDHLLAMSFTANSLRCPVLEYLECFFYGKTMHGSKQESFKKNWLSFLLHYCIFCNSFVLIFPIFVVL
jgi:hypothetical protein